MTTREASDEKKRCELMTNPDKRDAVNKLVASVRDAFPPGLSQPALRALARAGYTQLDQLDQVSVTELRKLHGMGPKAIRIIDAALARHGRSLHPK